MRFFIIFLPLIIFSKTISVSIPPQKYIIEQISKDFDINVVVKKGSSPATYSPKPSDLKAIKDSLVYFSIKVPFEEANLQKFKSINPKLKVVDMGEYLKRFPIQQTHHHHKHLDPHLWLSPPHIMLLARKSLEELIKLNPLKSKEYIANYNNFIKKLSDLDSKIYSMLKEIKNRNFVVYHPSFGYFARVYHLNQIAIESEGKEPSAKHIANLIKEAKGSKILIIEPQFPKRSAKFIAQKIGAKIALINPLDTNITKTLLLLAEEIAKYSR